MIRSVLLLALLSGLFACEAAPTTRRPDGYAMPKHRSPRPEPRSTSLERVIDPARIAVIVSSTTRDTNADGFGDRVEVSAMLFSDSGPDPVFADGEFVFELVRMDTDGETWETLGSWIFDAPTVRRAEGPTMFGLPGYRFELDLGAEAKGMQPASANLLAGFRPASGAPPIVPTQDQRLVRVGPVG